MKFSQWLAAEKLGSGALASGVLASEVKATAAKTDPSSISIQSRFDDDNATEQAWQLIHWIVNRSKGIPPWGTQEREKFLRAFWHKETLLSGAVHSSISKILGLGWVISGGRNSVNRYAGMLRGADGSDWGTFLSKFLLDYLTTDRGAFLEFASKTPNGTIEGIYNLDSIRCRLTGNWNSPVKYQDIDDMWHEIPRSAVFHSSSMPSADVTKNNLGFCAVSRSIRAAEILILVAEYEKEKLSDLPPNAIAAVSGLTPKQFRDAMKLYSSERENRNNLVYPGILWLVGNPGATGGPGKVSIDMTSFSALPEAFDKKVAVDIYAKTLALAFGVDVNEFWQIEHVGATKASAWIQAQKAKGKFPAVIIATLERAINTFVLPPGVVFRFELQDADDRLGLATLHSQEIANVAAMKDANLITEEEGKEILISTRVLSPESTFGPSYVETDITGVKTVDNESTDYIVVNKDGVIIYDKAKTFAFPHKIETKTIEVPLYRSSKDINLIGEAWIDECEIKEENGEEANGEEANE